MAEGIRARSRRGPLAQSWWGRAFIDSMEELDETGRMVRGRTYARQGNVLDLRIEAGRAVAQVQGSAPRPYKVTVRLRVLDAGQREALRAVVASTPAFVSALLAGTLPQGLAQVATDAEVPLLPARASDLSYDCSCPDWGDPCKHAAAVVYLIGEHLDSDPFALLKLRGVTRTELMEAVLATGALAGGPRVPPPDPHLVPAGGFADLAAPLPPLPDIPAETGWAIRALDHSILQRGTSTIELWLTDMYAAFAPGRGDTSG